MGPAVYKKYFVSIVLYFFYLFYLSHKLHIQINKLGMISAFQGGDRRLNWSSDCRSFQLYKIVISERAIFSIGCWRTAARKNGVSQMHFFHWNDGRTQNCIKMLPQHAKVRNFLFITGSKLILLFSKTSLLTQKDSLTQVRSAYCSKTSLLQ